MDNTGDQFCLSCKVKGRCCHYSISESKQKLIHPTLKCKYLNDNNECEVFSVRFAVNPECQTMDWMLTFDQMPDGCLYIKGKGARTVSHLEGKRIFKKAVKIWKQLGRIPCGVPDDLRAEIEKKWKAPTL